LQALPQVFFALNRIAVLPVRCCRASHTAVLYLSFYNSPCPKATVVASRQIKKEEESNFFHSEWEGFILAKGDCC